MHSQSQKSGNDAVKPLLQALNNKDSLVRLSAVRKLGKIASETAIIGLLQTLNDKDADVRAWAAWALASIASENVVNRLVQALHHETPHVRIWAIWAITQIRSQESVHALLQALKHKDPEVRWRAASGLGKICKLLISTDFSFTSNMGNKTNSNDEKAALIATIADRLMRSINDSDHYVRGRVAVALGKLGTETAVEALRRLLNDEEFYVRWRAAEALGAIGNETAVGALLPLLQHEDTDVRSAVVSALGQINRESAINGLIEALNDSDSVVRGKAVTLLGEIGNEVAIKGLMQALKDPNFYVHDKADEALQRIYANTRDTLNSSEAAEITPINSSFSESQPTQLPTIYITSHGEASEYILSKTKGPLIKHIISISSPGVAPPHGYEEVPHRLRLEFDDIETPRDDPDYVLATSEDIQKVIDFVPLISQHGGNVLIHCQAGISRSSAIALTICAALLGADQDQEALNMVLTARPQAKPNKWLVQLADEALGREEKLLKATQVN